MSKPHVKKRGRMVLLTGKEVEICVKGTASGIRAPHAALQNSGKWSLQIQEAIGGHRG